MSAPGGIAGYPPSPYIVNLIELQNTINNASGLTTTNVLSNAITDIQKMVDFQNKQINTNFLASYDSGEITVLSNMNFSNATLTVNGAAVSGNGTGSGTTLTTGSTSIVLLATSSPAISLNIANFSTLTFNQDRTAYFFSTVTCYGNVQASNFITLSDSRFKRNIETLETAYAESVLDHLKGVRFNWNIDNSKDIGLIAQTTREVLPEAVYETKEGLTIAYNKVIPVLVESVKGLKLRVESLEKEIEEIKSRQPAL